MKTGYGSWERIRNGLWVTSVQNKFLFYLHSLSFKKEIPPSLFVIPSLLFVIPTLLLVIPAKAGIQENIGQGTPRDVSPGISSFLP